MIGRKYIKIYQTRVDLIDNFIPCLNGYLSFGYYILEHNNGEINWRSVEVPINFLPKVVLFNRKCLSLELQERIVYMYYNFPAGSSTKLSPSNYAMLRGSFINNSITEILHSKGESWIEYSIRITDRLKHNNSLSEELEKVANRFRLAKYLSF